MERKTERFFGGQEDPERERHSCDEEKNTVVTGEKDAVKPRGRRSPSLPKEEEKGLVDRRLSPLAIRGLTRAKIRKRQQKGGKLCTEKKATEQGKFRSLLGAKRIRRRYRVKRKGNRGFKGTTKGGGGSRRGVRLQTIDRWEGRAARRGSTWQCGKGKHTESLHTLHD